MATAIIVRCECGASFERTDQIAPELESGAFDCPRCGREIASWDSAHHPEYRPIDLSDTGEDG